MRAKKAKQLRRAAKFLACGNLDRKYESKEKIKMVDGQMFLMVSAINSPHSFRGIYLRLKRET